MTTTYDETNDPYLIDPAQHKAQVEALTGGTRAKVNWHNLPPGTASSLWRILPYPQVRGFFFMIRKHFNIPGIKGSLVCPRSFDDPANDGKKYFCAICDKFFEFKKSTDAALQAIAKTALRSSSTYYVNAVDLKAPEKGVGVLSLPYQVFQTLDMWITTPNSPYLHFSHPKMGRGIILQSKIVAGSQIPGQDGKEKREYTVMPEGSASPLEKMEWMDNLYDLKTVVGIPTVEFTKVCLERIIQHDENIALPEGVKAYRGQLAAGNPDAETDTSFDTGTLEPTPSPVNQPTPTESTPAASSAPAFVQATTTTSTPGKLSEDEIKKQFEAILNKGK